MISLLNTVWAADYGDPSRKLVMLCLADMANAHGICWPSVATIAKRCGLHRRSVLRHLRALAEAQHITIKHQFRDGKKAASHYQIQPKHGDTHDTTMVTPTSHRTTNRTSGVLIDPKSMLTRPTQLPLSKRGRKQ